MDSLLQYLSMSKNQIYTWKTTLLPQLALFFILFAILNAQAPFIKINTVHQPYSEFQVNLILNQNRNHPIIMTTISTDNSKAAARQIMEEALRQQNYGGFGILIDCRQFAFNLNRTLGICGYYDKNAPIDETNDPNFSCQLMAPAETKIHEKGHILSKNHAEENLESGKLFTVPYLSDMIKKNIPDFVKYIEDFYDLGEFLQNSSDFKSSKLPKLLYFDENLLAPLFLRKIAALLDGKFTVGVTDQIQIGKKYGGTYDQLLLLQFDFNINDYTVTKIEIEDNKQISSILNDANIQSYMQVKKFRDIVLDFEHSGNQYYNFSSVKEVWNLQTHGRIILLQISESGEEFSCSILEAAAKQYENLFNYVCFGKDKSGELGKDIKNANQSILMIIDDIKTANWVAKQQVEKLYDSLPKVISRQRVSTQTEAEHCLRTASLTNRDPIFYYFNEKSHHHAISIMNYLNSLPQVTSLLYFCQFYLPDEATTKKFTLKLNTLFTLSDPSASGQMQKLQHSAVQTFLQIKMFLREVAIKKMLTVYQNRLLYNEIYEIKSNDDLTEKCFNKNCIIGLIASGRYREAEEMKMLKQIKLHYEEQYEFVWINGICHWDVPKQLKILKKKEKVIDKSYVIFYNEKEISYSIWQNTKFWEIKSLNRWIKSLRNSKNIKHLKFGIDIEDRQCKAEKKAKKSKNQEL